MVPEPPRSEAPAIQPICLHHKENLFLITLRGHGLSLKRLLGAQHLPGTARAGSPTPSRSCVADVTTQWASLVAASLLRAPEAGPRVHEPLLGTAGTLGHHVDPVFSLGPPRADLGSQSGSGSEARRAGSPGGLVTRLHPWTMGPEVEGEDWLGEGNTVQGPGSAQTHHAYGVNGVPLGHSPHAQGQDGEVGPGIGS